MIGDSEFKVVEGLPYSRSPLGHWRLATGRESAARITALTEQVEQLQAKLVEARWDGIAEGIRGTAIGVIDRWIEGQSKVAGNTIGVPVSEEDQRSASLAVNVLTSIQGELVALCPEMKGESLRAATARDGFMKAREAAARWHDGEAEKSKVEARRMKAAGDSGYDWMLSARCLAALDAAMHRDHAKAIRSLPLPADMEEEKVGDAVLLSFARDGEQVVVLDTPHNRAHLIAAWNATHHLSIDDLETVTARQMRARKPLPSKDIQDGD